MLPDDIRLIGALYEGPLEDPPWGSFLEALRVRFDALTATWIVRATGDAGVGLSISRGVRRFEVAYRERFFASDPFVNLPEGEVMTLRDLLSLAELRESAFYRQLLEPAGVLHVMGVDLAADGLDARLRISRGPRSPRYTRADRLALTALVSHARRSLRLYARVTRAEGERDAYSGAADRLAMGVLLLDVRGRIVSHNKASERASSAGVALEARDGRPVAATAEDTRRLREAIERALAARAQQAPALVEALQLRGRDGTRLGVLVRSLPRDAGGDGRSRPALALFVGDPEARDEIPIDALRGLFGFTPAEANLAARLAAGLSLDESAEQLAIARNTARAHLRAIFEKTGASRQAELVRLILRSVATLG